MRSPAALSARIALAAAIAAASVPAARADGDQAFLGIFAETSLTKMAGMPAPKLPPGFDLSKLPPGVKLPPQALAMLKGTAARALTVRLWSPGIAPDNATASLAIPEGLKLGPKLDLDLYRPKPGGGDETVTLPGGRKFDIDQMTIKRYWGSSRTVRPGQPDVIEFKGLTPEQQAAMRAQASKMQARGSYFYKPDWTTGYWPGQNAQGTIEDDAALQGHYALTTTYTGNVEIDVPANVNFLAPIEMTSPNLEQPINFDEAIVFDWKPVPNALGFHAMIFGMQQANHTIIMWDSSEPKPEMGMDYDYKQMAEVRDLVSKDIFMKGDRTEVIVPAGIFKDCDMVSFMMVGYGPGTALEKGQPLPRVQTKTALTIMLGGTMMRGFGGGRPPVGGDDGPR